MNVPKNSLSMCSFNCRSLKNSKESISSLCDNYDFIFIQEHWLLPNELPLLNNVHKEFISYATSAIDIGSDVLTGRPYGGTAVLYHNRFSNCVTNVTSYNSRICGVILSTDDGNIMLISVYMPTNYGDDISLLAYIECLCNIQSMIAENNVVDIIIAGDFNCSINSRFYVEFTQFIYDNCLVATDLHKLDNNTFTYIKDDGSVHTWIDHIVSSRSMDDKIENVAVLYHVITSDHKPVSFSLRCNCTLTSNVCHFESDGAKFSPLWQNCDDVLKLMYSNTLDAMLQNIILPLELNDVTNGARATAEIDNLYDSIVSCISSATTACIPHSRSSKSSLNTPGWNTYVKDKHDVAREAFLEWLQLGKPRCGVEFELMKRTRSQFKLALRYCRAHVEQMKADACADSAVDSNARKFWTKVNRMCNDKVTKLVTSIEGVSGNKNLLCGSSILKHCTVLAVIVNIMMYTMTK